MSGTNTSQVFLQKAQDLLSRLSLDAKHYLSLPIVRNALVLAVALRLLKAVNGYLSRNAQNSWTRARPWNAPRELVLLTGGSSGIGKQIMLGLAGLGVRVVIWDIQEPAFALPPNVSFYKVDLASSTEIRETAAQVRKSDGHPTILINNAGVGLGGTILDESEDKIRLTLEVNTLSHFWTVKEFLPNMIAENHGHVVTMASMASFASLGEMADYGCSKAAALAFHESLTQEIKHWYRARGVRASIIHPMWVATPMTSDLVQNQAQFGHHIMTPSEVSQAVVKQLVSGYGGQVAVPSFQGAALIRGLPNWIQEWVRDWASQGFVRLRHLGRREAEEKTKTDG